MSGKNNKVHWTRVTHLFRADEYVCSGCGFRADKAYKQCPGCRSEMGKNKYDPNWVDEMVLLDILNDDF